MSSEGYNSHYRDLELTEFTDDELVERFKSGLPLSCRQARDAERILRCGCSQETSK